MEERQVLAVGAVITHQMSLEEAVNEYIRIDARIRELYREKERCLEVLLPEAQEAKGRSNTTRLTNHDQSKVLKVEYGNDYRCNVDRLNTVKELIGDDQFEGLFKVEYKARLSQLKPFLSTRSSDEQIETAKTIIKEAVVTVPKTPKVTIEKGREIV